MEAHTSYTSLIIVLLAAFLTPILMKKLRLSFIPVVVAEIIAGLIIGKTGLNLIDPNSQLLTILSDLGFIFLMFLSGVEIDFSVFAGGQVKRKLPNGKTEPNRLLVSLIVFASILILSYGISVALVLAGLADNAFFMTLVISTISMGVVVPTLKESNIMKSGIGQIILIITIIADLVTMILLSVFVSLYKGSGASLWLLLVLLGVGILLYFVGKFFRHRTFFETLTTSTVQIGTRAVFVLIMLLVGLSQTLGAEAILGAFVAGALVSLLSPNREMEKQLDSFGYGFLIPIFFVMVGVDLNLWTVFKDPLIFVLIPLLLIGLFLSKLAPILFLKRWYDWNTVLGSGFLLTSTLSLVVAAAKIGKDVGVIETRMSSAFILLAVIASVVSPILFKKVFPLSKLSREKKKVAIIGANQLTLPTSLELDQSAYDISVYHGKQKKMNGENDSEFLIHELDDYHMDTLTKNGVFDADLLVTATNDDHVNSEIAYYAKEHGMERVIARIERVELRQGLREQGVQVFSSLLSAKSMLKVMIESPDVADIFTTEENGLTQVEMNNAEYDGVQLRHFPFLGDTIIVRIYRGKESLIPHGDTEIRLDDHLIVTGSREHVEELRRTLS